MGLIRVWVSMTEACCADLFDLYALTRHNWLMKQMYMVGKSGLIIFTALFTPPWFDLSSCLLACEHVLPQPAAQYFFIPIRHTQVSHTVLKEGLWIHSGVASTEGSCRSKQCATELIWCKFSFMVEVHAEQRQHSLEHLMSGGESDQEVAKI